MTSLLDDVVIAAAALVRARRASCEGCNWWPPMTIAWRDADAQHQWWMSDDLGPAEPCLVCGRVPVIDLRVYRLRPNGWLEAQSEPNVPREVLQAAARQWVALFVAAINEHPTQPEAVSQPKASPDDESDDYDVKFWARWRGDSQRVPPAVLAALLERDPWWRSHHGVGQPIEVDLISGQP
jgi:hypothetical protein